MIPGITEGANSTHNYKGEIFIVDYYPAHRKKVKCNGVNTYWFIDGSWQCVDSGMIVKGRGNTKEEAIKEAHQRWDEYCKKSQERS